MQVGVEQIGILVRAAVSEAVREATPTDAIEELRRTQGDINGRLEKIEKSTRAIVELFEAASGFFNGVAYLSSLAKQFALPFSAGAALYLAGRAWWQRAKQTGEWWPW